MPPHPEFDDNTFNALEAYFKAMMLIRVIGHQFRTLCVDFFVVSLLERMWTKKNEKRARANLAEGQPMRPMLLIGLFDTSALTSLATSNLQTVVRDLATQRHLVKYNFRTIKECSFLFA